MEKQIDKIFNTLLELNEEFDNTLIDPNIIKEETENISEIKDLEEVLEKRLQHLKEDKREKVVKNIVLLHSSLCDIEWQYDQLHDIIRIMMGKLAPLATKEDEHIDLENEWTSK